ncbi:hypothetical protein VTK26DRAFT_4375 [Humicola hyalothermophila]
MLTVSRQHPSQGAHFPRLSAAFPISDLSRPPGSCGSLRISPSSLQPEHATIAKASSLIRHTSCRKPSPFRPLKPYSLSKSSNHCPIWQRCLSLLPVAGVPKPVRLTG